MERARVSDFRNRLAGIKVGAVPEGIRAVSEGILDKFSELGKIPLVPEPAGVVVQGAPKVFDATLPAQRIAFADYLTTCADHAHVIVKGFGVIRLPAMKVSEKSVRIEFQSQEKDGAVPLTFQPEATLSKDKDKEGRAWLTVDGGTVELVNARWRTDKAALASLITVSNGSLFVRNCDLQNLGEEGAAQPVLIDCRSLRATGLKFKDSLLASRKKVLSLNMANSAVAFENCLLISFGDGISVEEGSRGGIRLTNCTLAARTSAVRVPAQPSGLKFLWKETVFGISPRFEKNDPPSTVISYRANAPSQMEWWEEDCAYERTLAYRSVDNKSPEKIPDKDWNDLWGAGHVQNPAQEQNAVSQKPLPTFTLTGFPTASLFRLNDCDAIAWGEAGNPLGMNPETVGPVKSVKTVPATKDPPKTTPKGTPPASGGGTPKPSVF